MPLLFFGHKLYHLWFFSFIGVLSLNLKSKYNSSRLPLNKIHSPITLLLETNFAPFLETFFFCLIHLFCVKYEILLGCLLSNKQQCFLKWLILEFCALIDDATKIFLHDYWFADVCFINFQVNFLLLCNLFWHKRNLISFLQLSCKSHTKVLHMY